MQSLGLDVKVLTEDRDEVKLRDYSDEELDFESTAVKKDEDLKEVDLLGDDNIFGGFATESTGIDNLFDTGDDDDENIFSALTESVPDMFDLFGDKGGSDEE